MEGMGPAILQGQQMQRQAAERKRLEEERKRREQQMASLRFAVSGKPTRAETQPYPSRAYAGIEQQDMMTPSGLAPTPFSRKGAAMASLVDLDPGAAIDRAFPVEATPDPFTLGPDQARYSGKGDLIAKGVPKPPGQETWGLNPEPYMIDGRLVSGVMSNQGNFRVIPGTPPPSTSRVTIRPRGMGEDSSGDRSFAANDPELTRLGRDGWTDVRLPLSSVTTNIDLGEGLEGGVGASNALALDDIRRSLDQIDAGGPGGIPLTGIFSYLSIIPGLAWNDLADNLETIKRVTGLNSLQELRANSPTGAGLGNTSNWEGQVLQGAKGNLSQAQSGPQLQYNLRRLDFIIKGIVNGVMGPDGKPRQMTQEDLRAAGLDKDVDVFGNPIEG
jgi:hypothetical protein